MFSWMKDNNISIKSGVEVGVMKGGNAKYILDMFPSLEKLYLVDCWHLDDYEISGEKYPRASEKENYYITQAVLEPYKNRVVFVPNISRNAVDKVNEELDFVYIDANHAYEWVKEDFTLWYPKVRKGGIIGGHDFHNVSGPTKFLFERAQPFFVCGTGEIDGFNVPIFEWWIIKE